jgi:nicotinamide-nucleotide amidase
MGPNQRDDAQSLAEQVGALAQARGVKIAVAESLTSGAIANRLGAAPQASTWFAGGVVAYSPEVKFKVLDVEPGPVVTARCAAQMAGGAARLLAADLAVAATGVGGPEPDEGHPAGTVYLAVAGGAAGDVEKHQFDGDPARVIELTTIAALRLLLTGLEAG